MSGRPTGWLDGVRQRALRAGRLAARRLRRDRFRRPAPALAGAAATAVAVVGTGALALVLLTPLPGRGGSGWQALDLTPVRPPSTSPTASPVPPAAARARPLPGPLEQPSGEFAGWAILDRQTGAFLGSDNMAGISTTASLIKPWLVADLLRLASEEGWRPGAARLDELELIIRDSHNGYAEQLFHELGGAASIERLIALCGLTDSRPYPDYWSRTQLSPRDTARLGACLADGTAAGPEWTDWVLEQMRGVRGAGDFGIRQAFPAGQRDGIAIKNGWIDRDHDRQWHVNCLAIGDTWTMGVMLRYPVERGVEHGAEQCRSLAEEYLLPMLR